ncbi:MAG: trimethylamine methyltransferase family protein [Chloroflexota bacterium]|nr:trimethylamine methyltransferase family protein [Chloroflexota bacterium]
MRVNYRVNATPVFRVLSDDQVEEIYHGALEVLERTGTRIYQDEALRLLRKAGAMVEDENLVHIPPWLVKAGLAATPERITLTGRTGKYRIILEKDKIYFGTGSDCPFIIDPYTDERRHFTYQDIYNAAKIADALPNIDFHMSHGLTSDVPIPTYDRHQFLAMLEGCTKPFVITAVDGEGLADQYKMACTVLGGEEEFAKNPLFVIYIEPSSPLFHSKEAVDKLLYCAEKGIPAIYAPCPIAGGTGPTTLAGLLVQALAECLVGIVIGQLKKKGTPIIIGGVVSILDMKLAVLSYGAPELSLLSAAFTDIAKWLRLPMFSTAGCSDAKVLDQQAAIEAAMSIAIAALSGANLIHDVGYMESGLVGSDDMLVMSNEVIGMVKRIMRGIAVDEESLALEVIDRVGPGGHYLGDEHTLKHFRTEFWYPELMNRKRWKDWAAEGKKTLGRQVRDKVIDLIENYEPAPIPEDVHAELKAIVASADERHREK